VGFQACGLVVRMDEIERQPSYQLFGHPTRGRGDGRAHLSADAVAVDDHVDVVGVAQQRLDQRGEIGRGHRRGGGFRFLEFRSVGGHPVPCLKRGISGHPRGAPG